MNNWIIAAYLLMNVLGLILMGNDKRRAIKHQYRIPEKNLWFMAFFGGAVGTTVGMKFFRHKTKHTSFKIGFPLLAVIEIILFVYFCLK